MDIQRLRNLTTGKLHTRIQDVYEDLEMITRGGGILTHMIPRVNKAIEPWLREKVTDPRFWNGEYDPSHIGDFPIQPMTDDENKAALKRYDAMPSPLAGKYVMGVEL